MTDLDPALTVPCPTCYVKKGEPCRSRHAVTLHQSRRAALADLGRQADSLLAADRPVPERREPGSRPVPVLVGKTGGPVPDDDEERPPWD